MVRYPLRATLCFNIFNEEYIFEHSCVVYIGRVLKVDGAFAAVRFPNKEGFKEKDQPVSASNNDDIITLLQDCRLMRKDDLQV